MSRTAFQVELPEKLYISLKSLGYQKQDIERECLEDVVLQLYAKHAISLGKAASIMGLSAEAFRETLLKRRHLPVEYFTEEVYEDDLKTIESLDQGKLCE